MSMIGMFRLADDQEIEALLNDPGSVEEALYPGRAETGAAELEVDKAWHAIHFLLCGDPWEGEPPLGFIVAGGTALGEDLGYGPARAFGSSELAKIVAALEPITAATLKDRYDAAAFAKYQIYPDIWDEPESECLDGYVLEHFDSLKRFLQTGTKDGKGLIVYLT